MAAHRYWRATAIEAYAGGDLELSCFHLLDVTATRVDVPAALAANIAPNSGLINNLRDDDLTTMARWAAQSVPALTLDWDFGVSPVDVTDIRLAGDSNARFPLITKIQWSDDAVIWSDLRVIVGITYPGIATKTSATNALYRFSNWRLYITENNGDTITAIQEVELRSTPGGADQTTPAMVATASSIYDGSWPASKAFDNSTVGASVWLTALGATFPQWLAINMVGPFAVAEIAIWPQDAVAPVPTDRGPRTIVVQGKFAWEVDWTTVASFTGLTDWSQGVAKLLTLPLDTRIRLNSTQSKATSIAAATIGNTTAIIYGTPRLIAQSNMTIESGSVKDFTTGVIGSGRGRITGTIMTTGAPSNTPVYRKVRLVRERDGVLIRELWSNPTTGAYSFDYIDEQQKFTVLSYDHTGAFRAVVASGITPELIV